MEANLIMLYDAMQRALFPRSTSRGFDRLRSIRKQGALQALCFRLINDGSTNVLIRCGWAEQATI